MRGKAATRTIGVSVMSIVCAVLSLTAFGDPPAAQVSQTASPDARKDPFVDCAAQIAKDPQYAELSRKLPIKDGQISSEMLAEQSVAMVKELPVIKSLYERHRKCWEDSADFRKAHLPPEVLKMINAGGSAAFGIGADLYNQKISFAEANKRLQEMGGNLDDQAAEIAKRYQAELAALNPADARATDANKAKQEAQRQQQIANYTQATPQLAVPLHSIASPGCQAAVNTTNCPKQ
jgi:hypothetical protein